MTDVSKMSDEELIAESREWCAVSTMWQDRINIELASRLEAALERERKDLEAMRQSLKAADEQLKEPIFSVADWQRSTIKSPLKTRLAAREEKG